MMTASIFLRGALAIATIMAIGWLDYVTGPRWGFSLFYLVPIVAVGWALGARAAILVASAAAIAWLLADLAWHDDAAPSLWNGATRLVIYAALGVMTSSLRHDRERLRGLLEAETRTARTDALTGLVNSRAFYERSTEELARSLRQASPLALMYLDLDNFKQVNDQHGHTRGDELLQEVAAVLRASVRATDIAARLGGDEFAILVAGIDRRGAEVMADRIVSALEVVAAKYPGTSVGGSVGVAWFATAPADVEALVQAGDRAMYRAKLAGKHRAVVLEQPAP